MKLVVNGETKEFPGEQITILELLQREHVQNPQVVTVQVNGDFYSSDRYDTTLLHEGDEVEFLYFIGGGR